MAIDDAPLVGPQPVTPSAASSAAPAIPSAAVFMGMSLRLQASRRDESAAVDGGAEQAQGGGAQVHQRLVEALQREAGAPVLPCPLAQLEQLELAPGVPAVGRVEGGAPGLGERGRTGQVGIRLKAARRVLDR